MAISRDSQVPYCQLSPKQHISCEISKGYFVLAPLFEYILDLFSEVDTCARSEASWPSFASVLSNSEVRGPNREITSEPTSDKQPHYQTTKSM